MVIWDDNSSKQRGWIEEKKRERKFPLIISEELNDSVVYY